MPISPRASPIGLPALRASSTASRSSSRSSTSASPCSSRARSAGRDGAPRRVGRLRARDRGVGLRDPRARDLGEHRLGGGLEHRERHTRSPLPQPLRAVRARLLDERADDPRGLVGLRVPLHAQREAVARHLEHLGQLVERRPARDVEPVADPLDALVVVRLGAVHRLARGARGERAVLEPHVVVGVVERAERAPVVLVPVVRRAGAGRACRRGRRSSPACRGRCRGTAGRAPSRARRARARTRRARARCPVVSGCGSAP